MRIFDVYATVAIVTPVLLRADILHDAERALIHRDMLVQGLEEIVFRLWELGLPHHDARLRTATAPDHTRHATLSKRLRGLVVVLPDSSDLHPRSLGCSMTLTARGHLRPLRIVLSVVIASMSAPASAQQPPRDRVRRFTVEQWDQFRPLFKLVEQAAAGQPVPSDMTLAWQSHVLKAESNVDLTLFT